MEWPQRISHAVVEPTSATNRFTLPLGKDVGDAVLIRRIVYTTYNGQTGETYGVALSTHEQAVDIDITSWDIPGNGDNPLIDVALMTPLVTGTVILDLEWIVVAPVYGAFVTSSALSIQTVRVDIWYEPLRLSTEDWSMMRRRQIDQRAHG